MPVNPMIDGVSRPPERDLMMIGFPPSTVATALYVVPRSIPMTGSIGGRRKAENRPSHSLFDVGGRRGTPRGEMVNVSIARRYARALLEASGPAADQVLAELQGFVLTLESSAELNDVISN